MLDRPEQVAVLVATQLGLASVQAADLIVEDLGAESMDIVNIVAGIEERFAISIDEDELPAIRSVADLQGLVERKSAG